MLSKRLPIWANAVIHAAYIKTGRCFGAGCINPSFVSAERAVPVGIELVPILSHYVVFRAHWFYLTVCSRRTRLHVTLRFSFIGRAAQHGVMP